jgi:hypothetical protein
LGGLLAADQGDGFGSELGRLLAAGGALLQVRRTLRWGAGVACAAELVRRGRLSDPKATGGREAGVPRVSGTCWDRVLGARRVACGEGGSGYVADEAEYGQRTHNDSALNNWEECFLVLL